MIVDECFNKIHTQLYGKFEDDEPLSFSPTVIFHNLQEQEQEEEQQEEEEFHDSIVLIIVEKS